MSALFTWTVAKITPVQVPASYTKIYDRIPIGVTAHTQ